MPDFNHFDERGYCGNIDPEPEPEETWGQRARRRERDEAQDHQACFDFRQQIWEEKQAEARARRAERKRKRDAGETDLAAPEGKQ